ncbi:MAG: phosphotriesterase-related protein [Myxococcota bacterium]|nr:phosphotriesterase [Myxococcales bacterium]
MTTTIQTVTGPIAADALGRTLMHEHLAIGYPGWEADTIRPGPSRAEMLAKCVDRLQEMKDAGLATMIDPCPNDLGRDVELMAEAAQRAGFQIVCATGLYKQEEGGVAYWHFRNNFGPAVDAMAELFIREIEDGIGSTGIKPGIIKVATGVGRITDYEKQVLEAAARASVATGTPITTHTDQGTMGDEQQRILTGHGVAPERIVVGHSCGTSDHDYHWRIARAGSYLGFDRFGLDMIHPDAERVASLLRLLERGAGDRIVVSHDTVWCWRGAPVPDPSIQAAMEQVWHPLHFTRRIAPKLREGGATDAQIERLLVDNPRAYFSGAKLAALS